MRTVTLHGKKAAGRVALVDDEDYALVSLYRWYAYESPAKPGKRAHGPYAITTFRKDPAGLRDAGGRKLTLRMHNLVMGTRGIDHADHDGLNNQRHNLRPATGSQNQANKRPRLSSTSKYKGVSLAPRHGKWQARIGIDGAVRFLGHFANEEDAALAYNAAALETFGPYACLNEIGPLRAGAA